MGNGYRYGLSRNSLSNNNLSNNNLFSNNLFSNNLSGRSRSRPGSPDIRNGSLKMAGGFPFKSDRRNRQYRRSNQRDLSQKFHR